MKTNLLQLGWRRYFALVVSIVTFFLSGCGGDGVSGSAIVGTQASLTGWVSANGPVASAKIAIYNIQGQKIHESTAPVTGDYGSFAFDLQNLPSDFKIVASGGTHGGEPVSFDLSAEYRGFNPDMETIYINTVTTMVSRYMASNTGKTLDQAKTAVKRYLEIPDVVDIGSGIHSSNTYFSYTTFKTQADANGGVSNYIDMVVAEINGGTPHAFPGSGSLHGAAGDLAGFVGGNLASGAVSYVGGQLMGWGLSQLGLGFPDKTAEALSQIKEQLKELKNQMKEMQNQLTQIKDQLTALGTQVQGVEQRLSAEIKQSGWDIRVGQISTLLINISKIRDDLTVFVTNPPSNLTVLNAQRADIMNRIETQLLNHDDDIHSQLVGIASSTPMLKLWSQVIKSKHRFLSSADSANVQAQFDYFNTAQLWLTELVVEYYHAKAMACDRTTNDGLALYNMYIDKASSAVARYNQHLAEQQALLLPAIPSTLLVDRDSNMWIHLPVYLGTYTGRQSNRVPPPVINGLTGYNWTPVPTNSVLDMFNTAGAHPYNYVVGQGWPSDTLDPEGWVGRGRTDDSHFSAFSLRDGSQRTVSLTSTDAFRWIFVTWPGVQDMITGEYQTFDFFW